VTRHRCGYPPVPSSEDVGVRCAGLPPCQWRTGRADWSDWSARRTAERPPRRPLDAPHRDSDRVMATDLVTVARNTSVEELHRLLVDEGLRLVPVVERDVLVGTVTRNDLLRTFLPRPSPDADAQIGDRRRAASLKTRKQDSGRRLDTRWYAMDHCLEAFAPGSPPGWSRRIAIVLCSSSEASSGKPWQVCPAGLIITRNWNPRRGCWPDQRSSLCTTSTGHGACRGSSLAVLPTSTSCSALLVALFRGADERADPADPPPARPSSDSPERTAPSGRRRSGRASCRCCAPPSTARTACQCARTSPPLARVERVPRILRAGRGGSFRAASS
jgi:hypothetical protein